MLNFDPKHRAIPLFYDLVIDDFGQDDIDGLSAEFFVKGALQAGRKTSFGKLFPWGKDKEVTSVTCISRFLLLYKRNVKRVFGVG